MPFTSHSTARAVVLPVHRATAPGKTQAAPWSGARQRMAGFLLCAVAAGAGAQSHEVKQGDVVLRSSTVASERISPESARSYGINPSPDLAILNIVVLSTQPGAPPTLPALVQASKRSLAGEYNVIEMKEVRANDRISYMGTYLFEPREVIDFEVTAQPTGDSPQEPLKLRYRERMWDR